VADLDSGPISLIDGVFGDVRKVLWVHEDPLELVKLVVDSIDQINRTILADRFHLSRYLD
jgi:hypothetical protein